MKAADAELILLNGQQARISDFTGRPIVLHFWATWCLPCVEEFPRLLKLAASHPEWQFIMVSVDEKREAIPPFLSKMEQQTGIVLTSLPHMIQVWDEGKNLSQQSYQTISYPETYLIDGDMYLKNKFVGPIPTNLRWGKEN